MSWGASIVAPYYRDFEPRPNHPVVLIPRVDGVTYKDENPGCAVLGEEDRERGTGSGTTGPCRNLTAVGIDDVAGDR